jgi:creatinine amidohydrolase
MKNIISDEPIFKGTMVDMTWQEVKQEVEKDSIVLFPISVVEEHGPHMDLSPDIYLTNVICKIIKQDLEQKGIPTVIAPPYYWGINKATGKFPGSFSVKPETFKAILEDLIECFKIWGFTKIFTYNFHGDPLHTSTIENSINEIRDNLKIDVYDLETLSKEININIYNILPTRQEKYKPDYHAGAEETSMMFSFYPDRVRVNLATELKPQPTFEPLGYVGDPAHFGLENGGKKIELISERCVQVIEVFLKSRK